MSDDLLKRFSPPVPKHSYKVEFVPQIEPSDSEYIPDPGQKDPKLEVVPHKFRSYKRCWCDNDAAASHSFGIFSLFNFSLIHCYCFRNIATMVYCGSHYSQTE